MFDYAKWKHSALVALGVAAPAVITALNGKPITVATVESALGAGFLIFVAVLIKSPVQDPGVSK